MQSHNCISIRGFGREGAVRRARRGAADAVPTLAAPADHCVSFPEQVRSTSQPWASQKSKDDLLDYAADGSGDDGPRGPQGEYKGDLEASGSGNGPPGDDDEDWNPSGKLRPSKTPDAPKDTDRNRVDESITRTAQEGTSSSGGSGGSGSSGSGGGIGGGTRSQPSPPELDGNGIEEKEDDRPPMNGNEGVYIMSNKPDERAASFFAQPGILAAVIGGAVVGLLCAILVVMFIVYRMRKKDEGSYALDEPKRSPTVNSYSKNTNREFFA
ncbi:hypothetical protein ONE63_000827 [Megalurothrips usitatus]|uniref:Syndecan n=1 Tax=Megalurothrips usitatus TaxID=439358 RepID=A0AAV7Y6H2_9NEOP|nr:hypothetical protein ONE63_000827 [Megalurothrips usitatus]